MENTIDKYFISTATTIRKALSLLNDLSGDSLVLLVVNDEKKLIGTLTDGDIRRGLIAGHELNDVVETIMHRDFCYLTEGEDVVARLHELRARKITFVPVLDADGKVVDVINLAHQRSCLPLDAIIMAGGKGERLRPLTEKTPKPLLKVGDKCIIDYNVDRLIDFGVKQIDVTVNYLGEQLVEHFKESKSGVQVKCYRETEFRGTMGAVKLVENVVNDTVLVMNSDLFTNIDFEEFFLHFRKHDADLSIAAVPYTVSIPFGICDLEGRNVRGIVEKPTYNYYANAGIYLMKREVLNMIPEDRFYNATDLIADLIAANKKVIRYPLNGTWIDIGNKQDYQKAQDLVEHLKW